MALGSGRGDLHSALKTEPVATVEVEGIGRLVLVRAIHGRDDVRYGLHAQPTTWSTAGAQTTDFLARRGFRRSACAFVVLQDRATPRVAGGASDRLPGFQRLEPGC